MELFFIIKKDLKIFIDAKGSLILEGNNGLYDISLLDYSNYLLPLLECERGPFLSLAKNNPLTNDLLIRKIIQELVRFPFYHKMEYWADLALNWIDIEDPDCIWLSSVDSSWMSQKLKHRVLKIQSQLKKN